ncbi:MAG: hypothetical protein KJ964_12055 [Verrucomicrobia bacterium]|nr:hypothetical protein [Verrucomicrobiota bacterium]MBU1734086.1 hypothetical protein [Verrucomicrobiota bacterium]MBU1857412.1 hypothetical protein [Verrucomicrobiota bacterium]
MFIQRKQRQVPALVAGLVLIMAVLPWTNAAGAETAVTIGACSNLDPASAADPLLIPVTVKNSGTNDLAGTLECEVLDYWFRPYTLTNEVTVKAGASAVVKVAFDPALRERLFKAKYEAGANLFRVNVALRRGDQTLVRAEKYFTFKNRIKDCGMLPLLASTNEYVNDLFGNLKLLDEVKCYDPADPHPYIEGGRGLGAKYSGAVPQGEWKELYRETNQTFTGVETILGQPCRVARGWGWFGYKLNREGLTPGKSYLLVVEYPEDVGRTMNVVNSGNSLSYDCGHGFHTGRTLGDHWTRTINSEYVDYPLSGQYRKYYSFFHLGEKVFALGGPTTPKKGTDSRKGFWVLVMGVGPSMDALASGAAVRSIKLYEVADVSSLSLNVNTPPLELGRRELVETSESSGTVRFEEGEKFDIWAHQLLHLARFYGMTAIAPNNTGSRGHERYTAPLMEVSNRENLGIKVFPRVMIDRYLFQKIDVPKEARVVGADGRTEFLSGANNVNIYIPDIVHPATFQSVWAQLCERFASQFADPAFSGLMFFKHFGLPFMPSFSDYAMKRFESETGIRAEGTDSAQKREWLAANKKTEYYQWWYAKEREFLLAICGQLQAIRPDLKLYYFPWHSDDDHPFSCGRLRYNSLPLQDKIYVPGTSILLVPGFTVPPEKWTPEQKAEPYLVRMYYREQIAPELAGKVTIEDILYGRHKDMKEFWGAKRNGEMPHLVYPEEMDMIKMLSEPGSIYSNHRVGCNPTLYANDKGIVYWAPVHYKYTADNPAFLNFFKTGEGVAVGNAFPYNEEEFVNNCYDLQTFPAIEHAGPFCMMEEVLSMANADPLFIMENKCEPLERGFPQYARAFAAAYLALPAMPSEILADAVEPQDKEIIVRQYKTDYGTYLAVINRAFDLKERKITVTVKVPSADVASVLDLVTGKPVDFKPAGAKKMRFTVITRPMQLQSFRIVSKTPAVAFRDVEIKPPVFSPNADGRKDLLAVRGRTVAQVTEGTWRARIIDAQGKTVREFTGNVPEVRLEWDGNDGNGAKCADGDYKVQLASSQYPQAVMQREITLAVTPPAVTVSVPAKTVTSLNWLGVEGKVAGMEDGGSILLVYSDRPEKRIAVWPDGTFQTLVEGLYQGDTTLSFVLEDRAGNRSKPQETIVRFEFAANGLVGFDFGDGPIMEGFNANNTDTFYNEKRGYGWIKYDRKGPVDRGNGDNLIRDYSSGKGDRAWAVKLPNAKYKVTVVMVDTLFDHFAPDIYVEGRKVVDNRPIKKNDPYRPSFEVELTDGLMNFEFKNPGMKLPYFALNGILIEPKP